MEFAQANSYLFLIELDSKLYDVSVFWADPNDCLDVDYITSGEPCHYEQGFCSETEALSHVKLRYPSINIGKPVS